MIFEDRQDAGRQLASKLKTYKNKQLIVLALPRGGVPVGFEIARTLAVPLDVLIVRKIGSPANPEFGIGAVAEGGVRVLDWTVIKQLGISENELDGIIKREEEELKRRVKIYRNDKPLPLFKNKTVIIVDDGLATGVTARAGIIAVKKQKPKQIIFVSPVCARDAARKIKHLVKKIICVLVPVSLSAIGSWYRNFEQITDEKVIELLRQRRL